MSGYVKSFDETKYTFFFIKDDELLKNYYKIWVKVSNIVKQYLIVNLYTNKISKN